MHPYNIIGMISIFITGLFFGIMTHMSNGLELSSAAHIANNITSFMLIGFGFETLGSEITIPGLIVSIVLDVVYLSIIVILNRKYNWFTEV